MKHKKFIKRCILLMVGLFFIGIGIAVTKRSELGISPVSSVANVLSYKFEFFTVGTWLTIWNCLLILSQILILRKEFKPLQLLQLPVSFLVGVFTDLGMSFVALIPTDHYPIRLSLVFIGIIILGFGISLTVIANVVMNAGEAFVDVVSKKLNKSFGNVKTVFDISTVSLSLILSLIFFDFTIVGAREGTVISALFTGYIIKFFTKLLKTPLTKFICS